jgi:hypothetical protein
MTGQPESEIAVRGASSHVGAYPVSNGPKPIGLGYCGDNAPTPAVGEAMASGTAIWDIQWRGFGGCHRAEKPTCYVSVSISDNVISRSARCMGNGKTTTAMSGAGLAMTPP